MREEDDAAESKSIIDDSVDRVSFHYAKFENYI